MLQVTKVLHHCLSLFCFEAVILIFTPLLFRQTTVNASIEWKEQKGTFSEPRTELYSTDDIFSPSNHSLDEDDSGRGMAGLSLTFTF